MSVQILLAEDNRADVYLVREALSFHGIEYDLHTAGDGAEAIRLIGQMGGVGQIPFPDILILDLNLPKADGLEILRRFRARLDCATTPVIVVTSSDAAAEREKIGALGVSRFFRKPANLDGFMELGAVVKEVLAT